MATRGPSRGVTPEAGSDAAPGDETGEIERGGVQIGARCADSVSRNGAGGRAQTGEHGGATSIEAVDGCGRDSQAGLFKLGSGGSQKDSPREGWIKGEHKRTLAQLWTIRRHRFRPGEAKEIDTAC
ncbi:hypothetical protein FRC10_000953 [Ceratobasidium sp. 414]|nr:hypothetical protein FRC10_000953 [Ceratobasidium sp. 414]